MEALFHHGTPELHVNVTNTERAVRDKQNSRTVIGVDVNEDNVALSALSAEGVEDTLVIDFPESSSSAVACNTLLIMQEGTNIYEGGERTLLQEVPSMSESSRDGVQSWTESMSARDRIRAVAETLREPRSVNWISEQSDAAWSTTNEELQDLVDQGQLRRVQSGETTRYLPDYTRLLFKEIRTLIDENTRDELRSELTAITEEIEGWQATYDVETWEELEQSLADGDLTSDELRDRRDVITLWRENEEDRRLIKHALELYSDVEAAREQMTDVADRATS